MMNYITFFVRTVINNNTFNEIGTTLNNASIADNFYYGVK